MASGDNFTLRILGPGDLDAMHSMLTMFGIAFEDRPTYDDQARAQVAQAREGQAEPQEALAGLISGNDTWTVV